MKYTWMLLFFVSSFIEAYEMKMLYEKNYTSPSSQYEQTLINHVKASVENAFNNQSKLNESEFANDQNIAKIWGCITPCDHLLNNLCSLPNSSHLHIGLLKGRSFIAALFKNQDLLSEEIGLDWFMECPETVFYSNCAPYLDLDKCKVINNGCFDLDKSIIKTPITIYFYDADHSLIAHEKAFTYYNDIFNNVFIAVVDDWKCPWIRRPTFKAFDKLKYQILYETVIPATDYDGHGQYVAVIKKSVLSE